MSTASSKKIGGIKVCYFLARYISHRKAGINYLRCLQHLSVDLVDDPARADIVIIHDEPWTYPGYFKAFPCLRQKYVVAYTVWEGDKMPVPYCMALDLVDEIWTASQYCLKILEPIMDFVFVVPHVVEHMQAASAAVESVRSRISYQDDLFYFYTITNALDVRKNLTAAIRSYARVADPARTRFVVKVNGGISRDAIPLPSVIILNEYLCEEELQALHHLGSCFVSAHCSEGWGMGISEAMRHGNLAVATAFGGNMDYMHSENSFPVRFNLERIRETDWRTRPEYWPQDMHWAYVNEEDMALKLWIAAANWDASEGARQRARADMKRYSVANISRILDDRLSGIANRGYTCRKDKTG